MKYSIWRKFYFLPRHVASEDGSVSMLSYRAAWPFILWTGLSLFLGFLLMFLSIQYVRNEFFGLLGAFCPVLIPVVAYSVDPVRHFTLVDSTTRKSVLFIRQLGFWRMGERSFKVLDVSGALLGTIGLRERKLMDSKGHCLATAWAAPSKLKTIAGFISLLELFSGGRSARAVGVYNFTIKAKASPGGPALATLERSNLVTGARELTVHDQRTEDFLLILAFSLLLLDNS